MTQLSVEMVPLLTATIAVRAGLDAKAEVAFTS
jgi:hypothetical protein